MKKIKINKVLKRIIFSLILVYFVYTLAVQQKMINTYQNDQKNYEKQIAQEKESKETLLATKENVNSTEYIEEVAREKLGMYLPNERVYYDMGK